MLVICDSDLKWKVTCTKLFFLEISNLLIDVHRSSCKIGDKCASPNTTWTLAVRILVGHNQGDQWPEGIGHGLLSKCNSSDLHEREMYFLRSMSRLAHSKFWYN